MHSPNLIPAASHICLTVSLLSLGVGMALHYRVDYRRSYLVNLGNTINLTCPYTAPFYKWTPATQATWILSEDQIYSLKAESLINSGKYVCSAVNGFGHNAAEFNIKVIDLSSPAFEQSCTLLSNGRVSDSGPCFLKTYSEAELSQVKAWGEDINLDCESAVVEDLAERVTYTWKFHPLNSMVSPNPAFASVQGPPHLERALASSTNSEVLPDTSEGASPPFYSGQRERRTSRLTSTKRDNVADLNPTETVARFTGPTLRIRKITLAYAGEYRCSVHLDAKLGDPLGSLSIGNLSRTFRVRVQPRSEGEIIQGPHNVTATIELGRDATFSCEINEEEHRSATIRWGKHISVEESGMIDFRNQEVLHWSGGTYIVLPTILPQNLQQFFDIPKPLAVSGPGSRRSILVLRSASPRDIGLYICSVITESGRDDHKFVHIFLKDGDRIIEGLGDIGETSPHLTIYIAVPICVFLVCSGAVTSLIIRNRSRHKRQCLQRNGRKSFFISKGMNGGCEKPSLYSSHRFLDHSSMAGSASMTFTRSRSPQRQGRSTVSSKASLAAADCLVQEQMRPSPLCSTNNTGVSQVYPTNFSPGVVHPYFYPNVNGECIYPSTDGFLIRPLYNSPPISTYGPLGYKNANSPNVDFQCHPLNNGVFYSGYPRSRASNAYTTEMGLELPGNLFMAGELVTGQDPQNRLFLCTSPSGRREIGNHMKT